MPLGLFVVRKAFGPSVMQAVSGHLEASIAFGFAHRPQALEFAEQFARDLPTAVVDRFVAMFVNELSTDMGDIRRLGLQAYLERAQGAGLLRQMPSISFIDQLHGGRGAPRS